MLLFRNRKNSKNISGKTITPSADKGTAANGSVNTIPRKKTAGKTALKSSTGLGAKLKSSTSALGHRIIRIAPEDKTLFCRYELKYHITEAQAAAVENFIKPYIHLDRYSRVQPDGYYPISSLYLDSDQFTLCRETLTGKKNRVKLRVRTYSDDPANPRFFEIKRRINNVILKSRAGVPEYLVEPIINGRIPTATENTQDDNTLRQFCLYMTSLNAKPVVLVKYRRKAYEDDSDNRVRITIDRNLCFKSTRKPEVTLNGSGWQSVPIDFVILEIKFTARYPGWLSSMVKSLGLKSSPMSKYTSSIKQSSLLGFCMPERSYTPWI